MNLALNQAKINLGNTKDNPSVGCVIIKNNSLISAGSTSRSGRPHAEFNAITFSKTEVNNSTLYATLEPCSNHGKTPPCVNLIINKKIKKVIFSIFDPDIKSFKKSILKLKKKNISFLINILNNDTKLFYRSYTKSKKKILPFVTSKLAISKDFYTINKKKKWITNFYSRGRVHLLRSQHDCIFTSSKTINKDNPKLTCRIKGLLSTSPSRIILDKNLLIKNNSHIIKNAKSFRTFVFYNKINNKKINFLKRFNIKFYRIPLDKNNNIDLKYSLYQAKKLGFSRIFLESGSILTISFLKEKLVDDFKLFISKKKIGLNGKSNIKNNLSKLLKKKTNRIESVNLLGDKLITYKLK